VSACVLCGFQLIVETEVVCNRNFQLNLISYIYASVKKPTIMETIRLNRLRRFGHVQRLGENRIPKRVLCMNLGTN